MISRLQIVEKPGVLFQNAGFLIGMAENNSKCDLLNCRMPFVDAIIVRRIVNSFT